MTKVVLWSLIILATATAAIANDSDKPAKNEAVYLQLMPMLKWNDLSEKQQELYAKGFLETLSFFAYGVSIRDKKGAQSFSDWTACAEHEPSTRWTQMLDWVFAKFESSGAWQCFKASEVICKKYEGKGDSRWNPVRLVSSAEWESFPQSIERSTRPPMSKLRM